MATIYCDFTTGLDTNDGLTKGACKKTLAAAITAAGNAGIVYVKQGSAETSASAITLTAPATPANRVKIICTNWDTDAAVANGASVRMTATTATNIDLLGYAYSYGVSYISDGQIAMMNTTQDNHWIFEACEVYMAHNTTSTRQLYVGASGSRTFILHLRHCTLRFNRTQRRIELTNALLLLEDTVFAVDSAPYQGTFINAGGTSSSNRACRAVINDCDLTASESMICGVASQNIDISLSNTKLAPGVALISPAPTHHGPVVTAVACDDTTGNKLYRAHRITYAGEVAVSDAVHMSGGLTYGNTPVSHKIATVAGLVDFVDGVESFSFEGAVTAGTRTFTVNLLHDSITNLTDKDVIATLEYLGTAGSPRHTHVSSEPLITATPTPLAASTETWTHSMTNPNKQKITFSGVSVARDGLYRVRVRLAKPNYTIYIDAPKVT